MEKGRREALPIEVGGKGFAGKRKKRIPRDVEVSREEAMEGMKRTAGTVLAHVGFEGEFLTRLLFWQRRIEHQKALN